MSINLDTLRQPTIQGENLLLRPMLVDDFESLYRVASDPLIWIQHPSPLRYRREIFLPWFEEGIKSKGALVVVHRNTDEMIGSSRYYDWDPDAQEIAIGFTYLSRSYWGGSTNAELKRLMIDHAFQWVKRVWFHVSPKNLRSQRALEKIGASLSHRGTKMLTGGSHDYLFYKVDAPIYSRHQKSKG